MNNTSATESNEPATGRSSTGFGRDHHAVLSDASEGSAFRGRFAISTPEAAANLLDHAWPLIVQESRMVLGGELHYQAVVYHCLRQAGAPATQVGMNVKQWIGDCVSPVFKARDVRKHRDFQGGFEPIPDLVVFAPDIRGDWRRRNYEATLRHMLMAIEVKASERAGGRLRAREIVSDLELAAHRTEVSRLGGRMDVAMIVIDTAPLLEERMTEEAWTASAAVATELGTKLYYVSGEEMLSI